MNSRPALFPMAATDQAAIQEVSARFARAGRVEAIFVRPGGAWSASPAAGGCHRRPGARGRPQPRRLAAIEPHTARTSRSDRGPARLGRGRPRQAETKPRHLRHQPARPQASVALTGARGAHRHGRGSHRRALRTLPRGWRKHSVRVACNASCADTAECLPPSSMAGLSRSGPGDSPIALNRPQSVARQAPSVFVATADSMAQTTGTDNHPGTRRRTRAGLPATDNSRGGS